ATVLNLSATAWSFVSSEPPDDSGLPAEILTAPSVFEAAGYLSFIDANHLGIIEHIYTWRHPAGASLRAALSGLDDGYLALFDPSGTLVREADDPYGEGEVHLETGPLAAGEYAIRVTTASGDGTGRYALRVWPDGSGGGQGASAPGTPTGALARVRSDR